MTIFDVIRYPLSDPPTEDELAEIPNIVWKHWRDYCINHNLPFSVPIIGLVYKLNGEDRRHAYNESMGKLRQLLNDYDSTQF